MYSEDSTTEEGQYLLFYGSQWSQLSTKREFGFYLQWLPTLLVLCVCVCVEKNNVTNATPTQTLMRWSVSVLRLSLLNR